MKLLKEETMKKRDIRGELQKREYTITRKIYYWAYRIIMKFNGAKYHAHFEMIDDIRKEKGSCFVLFNHLSRVDHYYVMEGIYPKQMNMLAGYSEFFRSHLHWVFKKNNCLPKKQYVQNDILGTKAMLKIIRKGGTIAFAPEGITTNDGMNKPIVPKTGSLLKKFGIPVYFVCLRGQYLQNNKCCLDVRGGDTYATISRLFTKEDLQKMSVEEIDDKINLAFKHDEYKWQKEKRIKWNMRGRACHRLDDLLYECPRCHSMFNMETTSDTITCKACGNGAKVNEYYDLIPIGDSIIPETQSRWSDMERISIIKEIRENKEFEFKERVKIGRLPNDHYVKHHKTSEVVGEGLLTINHDGFHYKDDKNSDLDFHLDYKSIFTTLSELDSSYFNIYVNGEYTDIFPERGVSLYINMLVEEMHRLHVNIYKNFKWNDYMYEGYENEV